MLEQMMQTAVQYIDTAMVGALGTDATAAVGATTTINWLINGTVAALGIGFLSFIARACGANDKMAAKRAVSQAVLATLTAGIFFTILTVGLSSRIPVWMHVEEGIQTLASRYFLILYLPMLPRTATIIFGTVLRAAAASAAAFTVGGIYITVVLWKHPLVSPAGHSLRPDMDILRPCLKAAICQE